MDELAQLFGVASSAGGSLPWVWIIEYISSFREIDTSIIRSLIKASPIPPDDLGKDIKEKIALRCLEELFDPNNIPRNVAPPASRVIFDLSASCQDVLQQILREVPVSTLKRAGPELLRWDVHPFITHKRASQPKCALEQLKASMLEEEITISYGDDKAPRWRSDDSDDETCNQEGNLIPQIHEDDTEVLQDERHSLPSRRCRSDTITGNLVGVVNYNQDNMHNDGQVNAKKLKKNTTCLKCNKNGKVLVCSSNGCPNVFHESCWNSSARVDEKGNFYCPFCAYSVAISEYLQAKEETAMARKNVAAFLELCSKNPMVEEWKLQSSPRSNGDENHIGIQENLHLGETEHILNSQNREVYHGASASCLNGKKLCIEEETFMSGAAFVQGQENEEEEKVVHGLRSMRGHVNQQDQLSAHYSCSDDNPTSGNVETIPANQVDIEGEIVKEAAQPQITGPPPNSSSSLNGDGEESSTAANDKFIVSGYAVRPRKREPKYTFPPIPQMRRDRVPWTKNEEEMLRRGVQMCVVDGGTVSWTRILEFGTSVFLKGRTAVDLKDKWRNMCKSSARCKSSDVAAQ